MFPKHYPNCYFFYFIQREREQDHRTCPIPTRRQEPTWEANHRSPHSSDCCYHHTFCPQHILLSTEAYVQRDMLLKRGSIQRENTAKKLWIFSHMPQSPFLYSTHHGYTALCKIFPSLGCCTDQHAEPRGWEECRSTCISKAHTPELWLSTLHVFMHRHMVFFLNKIWSSSGSTYNAVSYFKRIENF